MSQYLERTRTTTALIYKVVTGRTVGQNQIGADAF